MSIAQARIYQILIVEDNPGDVYIIEEAFKESGYCYALTPVASHEEALESLATTRSFDLILSDFGTNYEKAERFIKSARATAPRLPIVILSGSSDPNVAYDAGANAFVQKVINMTEFFGKIKGIMHFWVETAELPLPPRQKYLTHPA